MDGSAPPVTIGEPVCQCGHPREFHTGYGCRWSITWPNPIVCPCPGWADAPEPRAAGRLRWLP